VTGQRITDDEIDSIFSIPPETERIRILRRRLVARVLWLDPASVLDTLADSPAPSSLAAKE